MNKDTEHENMHSGLPCVIRIEMAIGTSTSHTTVYVFGWGLGGRGGKRQTCKDRDGDRKRIWSLRVNPIHLNFVTFLKAWCIILPCILATRNDTSLSVYNSRPIMIQETSWSSPNMVKRPIMLWIKTQRVVIVPVVQNTGWYSKRYGIRPLLFRDVMQSKLLVCYRRFGKN